jgi:2-keto-3-deoxy-L-rhamnonate aldolase RhmA
MHMADRLMSKIESGGTAFGALSVLGSSEIAMTMAASGLDFITIDQMYTATDWERTAHVIRAAKASGISPSVRLHTSPWSGGTSDLSAQVLRAQGIGATSVRASCGSPEEVATMIQAGTDWHRETHVIKFDQMESFEEYERGFSAQTLPIPILESQTTIEEFDACLAVEGLRAVSLGMTDLARILGHPFDYEHPEVCRMVERIVEICEKRGIVVGGNPGYAFRTPETIAARCQRMIDQGIRMITLQTDAALFQMFTMNILAATKVGGPR